MGVDGFRFDRISVEKAKIKFSNKGDAFELQYVQKANQQQAGMVWFWF